MLIHRRKNSCFPSLSKRINPPEKKPRLQVMLTDQILFPALGGEAAVHSENVYRSILDEPCSRDVHLPLLTDAVNWAPRVSCYFLLPGPHGWDWAGIPPLLVAGIRVPWTSSEAFFMILSWSGGQFQRQKSPGMGWKMGAEKETKRVWGHAIMLAMMVTADII